MIGKGDMEVCLRWTLRAERGKALRAKVKAEGVDLEGQQEKTTTAVSQSTHNVLYNRTCILHDVA